MITENPSLSTLLRSKGYSITSPRQAVFDALSKVESVSMNELVKQLPAIDRASVYRTVELFEMLGIVHRLQIGWKYKLELSDMFRDHHHHAVCAHCAKTFPIDEDVSLESHIQALGRTINFHVTSHALELRGLCSKCR